MPVYEKALTIPANTSEDAPVEATLEIEGDTVIRLEMEFPDGCFVQILKRLMGL